MLNLRLVISHLLDRDEATASAPVIAALRLPRCRLCHLLEEFRRALLYLCLRKVPGLACRISDCAGPVAPELIIHRYLHFAPAFSGFAPRWTAAAIADSRPRRRSLVLAAGKHGSVDAEEALARLCSRRSSGDRHHEEESSVWMAIIVAGLISIRVSNHDRRTRIDCAARTPAGST